MNLMMMMLFLILMYLMLSCKVKVNLFLIVYNLVFMLVVFIYLFFLFLMMVLVFILFSLLMGELLVLSLKMFGVSGIEEMWSVWEWLVFKFVSNGKVFFCFIDNFIF